jgi:hypothetical protein
LPEEDKVAQFLLLLHDDPAPWREMSPAEMQAWIQKYMAWGDKARKEGFYKASQKLTGDAGRVMRSAGPRGKPRISDGPFIETKEVLGGYYLIEARDYDEAVARSLDHPHLQHGTIELRQVDEVVPH